MKKYILTLLTIIIACNPLIAMCDVKNATILQQVDISAPHVLGGIDISSDGTKVLFQEKNDDQTIDLKLFDSLSNTTKNIAQNIFLPQFASEYPPMMDDLGQSIIYEKSSASSKEIYVYNVQGEVATKIFPDELTLDAHPSSPFITDDGLHIYFFIVTNSDAAILSYDVRSKVSTRLTGFTDGNIGAGSYIAVDRAGLCFADLITIGHGISIFYPNPFSIDENEHTATHVPTSSIINPVCSIHSVSLCPLGCIGTPFINGKAKGLHTKILKDSLSKKRLGTIISDSKKHIITTIPAKSGLMYLGTNEVSGSFIKDNHSYIGLSDDMYSGWAYSHTGRYSTFILNYPPKSNQNIKKTRIYLKKRWVIRYDENTRSTEILDTVPTVGSRSGGKVHLGKSILQSSIISADGSTIAYIKISPIGNQIRVTKIQTQ